MVKYIFLFQFFFFWYYANAQNNSGISCDILQKAIETKEFKDHFFICKYKDENLIVVDTNRYFDTCQLLEVCARKVQVSRDYPSNVSVNKGSGKENKNMIIIYKAEETKNIFTLSFWQPYGNANMILELRKRKNKISYKVISKGVF